MKKIKEFMNSKIGAVSMEYVLVIAVVVMVLIFALQLFAGRMTNVIDVQGDGVESAAYESYCKSKGKTYTGSLDGNGNPICN